MSRRLRVAAVAQVLLVLPAGLFLSAALVGMGDPPQHDLARVAHHVVAWYVSRNWTLPLRLIGLPFVAGAAGMGALGNTWSDDGGRIGPQSLSTIPTPVATLVVASTTMIAIAILGVVGLHMLAN